MITDPISDMLTRIRNAARVKRPHVDIPASKLKSGLAGIGHVTLKTPLADSISAGIVCFTVDGMSPSAVVAALRKRRIIATVTPYSPTYARLAPGLVNTPNEVDQALDAIRELGKR